LSLIFVTLNINGMNEMQEKSIEKSCGVASRIFCVPFRLMQLVIHLWYSDRLIEKTP